MPSTSLHYWLAKSSGASSRHAVSNAIIGNTATAPIMQILAAVTKSLLASVPVNVCLIIMITISICLLFRCV